VQPEHQMRDDRSANSSRTLDKHVSRCFEPRNAVLNCVGDRNRGFRWAPEIGPNVSPLRAHNTLVP
jgi:hypothetical protein